MTQLKFKTISKLLVQVAIIADLAEKIALSLKTIFDEFASKNINNINDNNSNPNEKDSKN